jgi:hypothetical protein
MKTTIKIPLLPIQLFTLAGPTDRVFAYRGGRLVKQGMGITKWVLPTTSIAVVPTARQKQAFEFEIYTKDNQGFKVAGEITFEIDPELAVKCYDFTVDAATGEHNTEAVREAGENAVNILRPHFLKFAAGKTIEELNGARHELEGQIQAVVAALPAATNGVKIVQVAVAKGGAADVKISLALGAKVAEQLLAQADTATAERQKQAEENRRGLLMQQADTNLKVEEKRTATLAVRIKNEEAEAKARGEAIRLELEPFAKIPPTVLLAYALQKNGVGPITITPDFLAALGGVGGKGGTAVA